MICRAMTAWLNILAAADAKGIKGGVKGVLMDHYMKYGRTFFSRFVVVGIPSPFPHTDRHGM